MPMIAGNEYELRLFMRFLIYGILAVGLNVLVGFAGLVSLGQAGLFALGAYAAAILSLNFGWGLISTSIAAMVVASLFGALLAFPTVRVRGVYLAVVTIAFGLIIENVAIEWKGLTGGTTGLSGVPQPSLFGVQLSGTQYYAVLAGLLLLTAVMVHNIKLSRFGRMMFAIAQSETAARALGINVTGIRTLAFVIAAATAGLAGALFTFLNSYISPDVFTFSDSVRFLLMVIFGGAGTTAGPIVGAYILTYLPDFLQQFGYWQQFAYGALLAIVMFVLPGGIVGSLEKWGGRLLKSRNVLNTAERVPATAFMDGKVKHAGAELVADGLTIRFGGLTALNAAALRVKPGEIHALIGPNGAGKSTFINAISGFYPPDEGRVTLNGKAIAGAAPYRIARNGLARTFQNTELFGNMTVLENVMVGYSHRFNYTLLDACCRTPRFWREEAECRRVSIALIELLGLTDYAGEAARFLPFGLQRRLEIARALVADPILLLLDEPAAGLTTQEIEELEATIRKLANFGISVLLIEHHVDLIMALADTVTVLDYGIVIASDRPDVIQNDPRVIEAYFGTRKHEGATA